jgi:hypothetical protein
MVPLNEALLELVGNDEVIQILRALPHNAKTTLLVTRQFVYLHQPKTGGTFVAATLDRIHHARGARVETVWLDASREAPPPSPVGDDLTRVMLTMRNQHGTRRDIPATCADRPVVATVRSPYDRYVSQYEFAWWRVYPEMFGPVDLVREQHPGYPELTFAEFVELVNAAPLADAPCPTAEAAPGLHTRQFVEHFFLDPGAALAQLSDPAAWRGAWRAELDGILFLNQEHLNEELHAFLLTMDYPPVEIAFVLDAGRIRPLQPDGSLAPGWMPDKAIGLGLPVQQAEREARSRERWRDSCDPAIKALIREKERWLFEWFPQFDV